MMVLLLKLEQAIVHEASQCLVVRVSVGPMLLVMMVCLDAAMQLASGLGRTTRVDDVLLGDDLRLLHEVCYGRKGARTYPLLLFAMVRR